VFGVFEAYSIVLSEIVLELVVIGLTEALTFEIGTVEVVVTILFEPS
jgi:hypothetical protein